MNGYSVSAINPMYANDAAFWNAYNSFNPNYANSLQNQQQQIQAQQAQAKAQASSTTPTDSTGIDPTFKAHSTSASSEGTSTFGAVATTLAVVGGAAALIYAGKKGKLDFAKNWWNKLTNKATSQADDVTVKLSNVIKNGGKNLQEYTINKDGMSYIVKDGKLAKIITQENKIITDIAEWQTKNPSLAAKIRGIDITRLPKEAKLTNFAREIADDGKNYKVLYDKEGKIAEIFTPDKAKLKFGTPDYDDFVKNHNSLIDKANVFEYQTSGKIKLKMSDGNFRETATARDVVFSVKDGKVTSAKYKDGTSWIDIEDPKTMEKLQETFKDDIPKIGKETGYGIDAKDCIYEYQSGAQRFRFDGKNKKPFEYFDDTELISTDDINKYLRNNTTIKSELDNILATGKLPNNYSLNNLIFKNDAGHIFNINEGKVSSIILDKEFKSSTGRIFRAGDKIDGKFLEEWRKTAENNNEVLSVLALLV